MSEVTKRFLIFLFALFILFNIAALLDLAGILTLGLWAIIFG